MNPMSEQTDITAAETPAALTCAYPGCERPPRPGASEGRGSKPKYCDIADDQGRPAHTAMSAFRTRAALDRRAAGGTPSPADLDRPVADGYRPRVGAADGPTRRMLPPWWRSSPWPPSSCRPPRIPRRPEAQIEAVQAEAIAQVADARGGLAREAQRRQQAEADSEEARAAGGGMDEKLQAAEAAASRSSSAPPQRSSRLSRPWRRRSGRGRACPRGRG